ncbi:helix-turn-helix domain-containing protein, partial [Klebsiella pneumoniae]|uniref:helix-turn-helix domain-containing protein n=1 Tax=Klebsiella pneumoniae TaxID=573 RepID=UPI001C8F6001
MLIKWSKTDVKHFLRPRKGLMPNTFDCGTQLHGVSCQQEGCQMELGKQIKMYRTELKLSQDDLADKVYVT